MRDRLSPMKLLSAGGIVDAASATVGVAVWQISPHRFTHLAVFWIAVAIFVLGFALVLLGLFGRDNDRTGAQNQTAGDFATLYQAGRDLNLGEKDEPLR